MARLITSGAEIYVASATVAAAVGSLVPDGNWTGDAGTTRDTAVKRSGAASFKYAQTGINRPSVFWGGTFALDRGYWFRFYLRITTNVSQNGTLARIGQTNTSTNVSLSTTGAVYITSDTGTVSASLADGNWHRVEFYVKCSVTQANRAFELRVDGVTVKSGTAQTDCAAAPDWFEVGSISGAGGTYNVDDVAVNDDQGSAPHNTWPGDGYVVLLTPNADNTRGSWTGGAGGTTNLWDALNNTPPVGAVAPGTNTSQISANAVATTGKFDTTSYTAAGATAGHTAVVCQVVACHGEQSATGTKSGSASTDTAVNNTPSSTTGTFNYGDDAGTEGAWPSLWRWSLGAAAAYASQPTLSSGARLNIATTTASRVADCCFLGLYVEMQGATSNTYLKTGRGKENG